MLAQTYCHLHKLQSFPRLSHRCNLDAQGQAPNTAELLGRLSGRLRGGHFGRFSPRTFSSVPAGRCSAEMEPRHRRHHPLSSGHTSGQQMLARTLAAVRDKGSGYLLPERQSRRCQVQAGPALPLAGMTPPARPGDPPRGWQEAQSPPARPDAERRTPSTGSNTAGLSTAELLQGVLLSRRLPLTPCRHEAGLESCPSAAPQLSLPSPLAFGSSVWTLPGQTSLTVRSDRVLPKQAASRYPVNLQAGNRLWEEPGLA